MLAPYRDVMSTPGAIRFSAAGFLGRLPISTVTLGIVLLVVAKTGSFGIAGEVSAAYMIATALASPVLARLIDSFGQARILVPCFLGFAVGLVAMVSAVEAGAGRPVPHIFAAIGGVFYPPVGACVRARWTHALGQGQRLHTAFSFEAVVDEAIFITGPVLVTILATQVHEFAGIGAVVAVALVGGLWFASLRSTQPSPHQAHLQSESGRPLAWGWLLPMMLASICLGSLFGSTEVVTVAFAREHGHPSATAGLLALWAAGSLIAGVITGTIHWQASPLKRYRVGALGMACAMTPLPFIHDLAVMGAALFVAGFSISPTMVAAISLVEANVPTARLTEGITWVMTAMGLGVAPGAAIAGRLIDSLGASPAYYVPVVSGMAAALVAWSTGHRQPVEAHVLDEV